MHDLSKILIKIRDILIKLILKTNSFININLIKFLKINLINWCFIFIDINIYIFWNA